MHWDELTQKQKDVIILGAFGGGEMPPMDDGIFEHIHKKVIAGELTVARVRNRLSFATARAIYGN